MNALPKGMAILGIFDRELVTEGIIWARERRLGLMVLRAYAPSRAIGNSRLGTRGRPWDDQHDRILDRGIISASALLSGMVYAPVQKKIELHNDKSFTITFAHHSEGYIH